MPDPDAILNPTPAPSDPDAFADVDPAAMARALNADARAGEAQLARLAHARDLLGKLFSVAESAIFVGKVAAGTVLASQGVPPVVVEALVVIVEHAEESARKGTGASGA